MTKRKRPWWMLHWPSWLTATFVCWAATMSLVRPRHDEPQVAFGPLEEWKCQYGFPLTHARAMEHEPTWLFNIAASSSWDFSILAFIADVAFCGTVVFLCVVQTERLATTVDANFTIRTLLLLLTAVGVALGLTGIRVAWLFNPTICFIVMAFATAFGLFAIPAFIKFFGKTA